MQDPTPTGSLSFETQCSVLRRKLNFIGTKIKAINDQGRLIEKDKSQLLPFRGMFRGLDFLFNDFRATWDRFQEHIIICQVESSYPSKEDKALYSQVERYYYESNTFFERYNLPDPSSTYKTVADQSLTDPNRSTAACSRSQLTRLSLPQFGGRLLDWPHFRDRFVSLVHDDISIPDVEKFNRLANCLTGEALAVVNKLPILAENYDRAWKSLNDTFDNKRLLATAYLNRLLEFKPLTKGNVTSLKGFLSEVTDNISAFKRMNIPDKADFIIFSLAIKCLDPSTRKAFEIENVGVDFPTFDSLSEFVKNRRQALELSSESKPELTLKPDYNSNKAFRPNKASSSTCFLAQKPAKQNNFKSFKLNKTPSASSYPKCPICSMEHPIWKCQVFKNESIDTRRRLLKEYRRCENCLQPNHSEKECTSKNTCFLCQNRHHTLLHPFPSNSLPKSTSSSTESHSSQKPTTCSVEASFSSNAASKDIILGTALARIKNAYGSYDTLRMVVDSGSHHSFITEECASRLGFSLNPYNKTITGIGQTVLHGVKGCVNCSLTPLQKGKNTLTTEAVVVNTISPLLPLTKIVIPSTLDTYKSQLADPNFFKPNGVDFLLGADLFPEILTGGSIKLSDGGPLLLQTIFGLVVMGRLSQTTTTCSNSFFVSDQDMKTLIHRFWQVEEPQLNIKSTNIADLHCEEYFKSTYYRTSSGNFVVRLPFKGQRPTFHNSYNVALKRFYSLENKLAKNPLLYQEYKEFMDEYLSLGHMVPTSKPSVYVIPHHAVFKNGKIRVVFDGSCQTNNGSLNDHLYTGPKLQLDISLIILNFRLHLIVFMADIIKMFRQVLVDPIDRPYQHILWRSNKSEPLQTYELCTVTYGLAPSPYLAIQSLHQLVKDEGSLYPLASKAIEEDTYVDDIATGSSSEEDALTLQQELIDLLGKGNFHLSKWSSNSTRILQVVPGHQKEEPVSFVNPGDSIVKILGLQWDPTLDAFTYNIEPPQPVFTKRGILSGIARLYDPLGFLAPSILVGKIIFQLTWTCGVEWDEPLPDKIRDLWRDFIKDLPKLSSVVIPRHLVNVKTLECQLLCFSDASERAYCGVIYLRIKMPNNPDFVVYLLKAKTKLAPLKTLTIPRLELCAAHLLSKMYSSLAPFLKKISCHSVYCFSDSTIVLAWLKISPHLLKVFVANRIVEISNNTPDALWFHVRSQDNPADCGSRGISPSLLPQHEIWWKGPSWASQPIEEWPVSATLHSVEIPELKPTAITLMSSSLETKPDLITFIEQFSSYSKLLRIIAYCLRFHNNTSKPDQQRSGPLQVLELRAARNACIKVIQAFYFKNNSKDLRSLSPFVDECGLLRVGGRLKHAMLSFDHKHPIILPKGCHFSSILIDYLHTSYLHVGATLLTALLRQQFWICSARSLIRQRIFKCLKCYRAKAVTQTPYMGDLPPCRFQEGNAFQHVGVDYAGPFVVRDSLRRKATVSKAYLCLFVCMTTKALHLEAVSNLTTDAFLASLDRFISRRGKPVKMYSDCGTNFVGAAKTLKEFITWYQSSTTQSKIISHLTTLSISWTFHPPYAPHFGGLWEAGVKSVKVILRKLMTDPPFTFEELTTMFCKIEALLNSRPLYPLSSDCATFDYLTPGHFLIGAPLTTPPEPCLLDIRENRLSRWQMIRQRFQHFWNRWRLEYIHELQQRSKWTKLSDNLKVGDLVLLSESQSMPLHWPMGRVIETHPGQDGIVRVVTIKTLRGIFRRPVTKVAPLLPLYEQQTEN